MVMPPSSSVAASAADQAAYGLDELLELAGERLGEAITPRTVRLYATEGLIDRPGQGLLKVKQSSVPELVLASPAVPASPGCHGPGRPAPR